jgi:diguanylate cyclase (GGDEF)-like protein
MVPRSEAEPLGSGYHWVGSKSLSDRLQCNPYLLIDGDEAVLFDPGSSMDFEQVLENVRSLCPLDSVRYVVLHHHNPSLASSVPLFEKAGMRFSIVTHWRTWSLVRFYGLESQPYLVDEHGYSLILSSGRKLQFVSTPYLPFPGAMISYDKASKYLLSGELFGAFQTTWGLFPDEMHIEGLKSFHEHFMPSNDILRPVMEFFDSLDISAILPQHGPVITGDIKTYIHTLMTLDCGRALAPPRKTSSINANYRIPLEKLLSRAIALFGAESAMSYAMRAGVGFDPLAHSIVGEKTLGLEEWDLVAEHIFNDRGPSGLSILEPLIANLCHDFSINRPVIFNTVLQKSLERYENLGQEVARLKELGDQLNQSTAIAQQSLMVDAVTGLNNESFFRSFIDEQSSIVASNDGEEDDILAVVGIDEGMARIEYQYGPREVEAILKGVGRIIVDSKLSSNVAFRLHGATFALWMQHIHVKDAIELCEKIRRNVELSKSFIEPVTVSVGLVSVSEVKDQSEIEELGTNLSDIGIRRLRIARKRGGNTICSSSEIGKTVETKARVLIVDDDAVNSDVVRTFLENADYSVTQASDGDEAIKKISEEGFDIIISELMVPKVDGFMLKESLARRSGTKDIPFILFSHLKDETTIIRAYSLGIDYYLRKPYMLAELMGIVNNLAASGAP